MKIKLIGPALLIAASLTLSGCENISGVFDSGSSEPIDKASPEALELNERAKGYWHTLAEGNAEDAFRFLSLRCSRERTDAVAKSNGGKTEGSVATYEQRHINKMAFLRKSTDDIVGSMTTKIISITESNKIGRVDLDSTLDGISMKNLRWERSDIDNKWYLDSCRPPFANKSEDVSSFRLERERDERAYREGVIKDGGSGGSGPVLPSATAPSKSGGSY